MLSTLRRWLRTPAPTVEPDASTAFLTECVRQLESDVIELRASEVRRSAEHAAMVDQLDRLYKRVSARISRGEGVSPTEPAESPLALRQRLGR